MTHICHTYKTSVQSSLFLNKLTWKGVLSLEYDSDTIKLAMQDDLQAKHNWK